MASFTETKNGPGIFYFDQRGKRRLFRLGSLNKRDSATFFSRFESLIAAVRSGRSPDEETSLWLSKLSDGLYRRLVKAGLVAPRDGANVPTLAEFLSTYIATKGDKKPSTLVTYRNVERNLLAFFGEDRRIDAITSADAEDWRSWLVTTETLAENTCRKRSGIAKTMFAKAVRGKLIAENPFDELKVTLVSNQARQQFIDCETIIKVLDKCPDADWRAIFGLCRYGGLRCPSEVLAVRWQDVNFVEGWLLVRSPKTEHHGKAVRRCPLFPELRDILQDAYDQAPDGAEHVVTKYRTTESNLRTQATKIIERAGATVWPKLFHNLRASRQTELSARFPLPDVCAWLGNTVAVAAKHYLQARDVHFTEAATVVTATPSAVPTEAAVTSSKVIAKMIAVSAGIAPHEPERTATTISDDLLENPVFPEDSGSFRQMPDAVAEVSEVGDWSRLDSNQ